PPEKISYTTVGSYERLLLLMPWRDAAVQLKIGFPKIMGLLVRAIPIVFGFSLLDELILVHPEDKTKVDCLSLLASFLPALPSRNSLRVSARSEDFNCIRETDFPMTA